MKDHSERKPRKQKRAKPTQDDSGLWKVMPADAMVYCDECSACYIDDPPPMFYESSDEQGMVLCEFCIRERNG